MFIFMILTVTNAQTTFIYEASWVHLFIPLSLFVARRYLSLEFSCSYNVGGVNPAVVSMLQMQGVIVKGVHWGTFI